MNVRYESVTGSGFTISLLYAGIYIADVSIRECRESTRIRVTFIFMLNLGTTPPPLCVHEKFSLDNLVSYSSLMMTDVFLFLKYLLAIFLGVLYAQPDLTLLSQKVTAPIVVFLRRT